MSCQEVKLMELQEIIQLMQDGQTISQISHTFEKGLKTIRKYLRI